MARRVSEWRVAVDDRDLIARCRLGDEKALEAVFRTHAGLLEHLVRRILGPRAEVEDVLQNTLIAAVHAFPRFRGEASVQTWLSRIAVRTAIDFLRQPLQRRTSLELVRDPAADGSDPGEEIDRRRCLDRVYVHLDSVGPKKRAAFILHVFEGRPLEEVAALTGATRAATKSRVFWARRTLLAKARRDPLLRDLLASWADGGAGGEP